MEQEDEYKAALSIMRNLEKQRLDDSTLAKEQSDMINTIEAEIDRCIQALVARKETLISEVTAKFKAKRELMEPQQKHVQLAIESCKNLIEAGTSLYTINAEAAKKSWKITKILRVSSPVKKTFDIRFQPLNEIEQFGAVVEFGELSSRSVQQLQPSASGLISREILLSGSGQQANAGVLMSKEAQQALNTWLPTKKFTLLYQASRDGFEASHFHKFSDNKGSTVTLIRSHPHNYLFGGYTSQSWDSSSAYKTASDAFIFTITNPHGIPPTKFAVTKPDYATRGHPKRGPIFGTGNDIHVYQSSHENKSSFFNFPHGYADTNGRGPTTFTGERNFTTNEIEVYYVN